MILNYHQEQLALAVKIACLRVDIYNMKRQGKHGKKLQEMESMYSGLIRMFYDIEKFSGERSGVELDCCCYA